MSYRVVCEWDGELWYVKVPSIPGCHTQGKNLTETQRRIREALSLFVRDAKKAELELEFVLPKSVRTLVARTRKLRAQAEAMQAAATEQLQASAAALEAEALSYRDIGAVLDLSHQRIQQVLAARGSAADRKARGRRASKES